MNLLEVAYSLQKEGKSFVICTITATSGSVPRKIGSKIIIENSDSIYGTVGGGSIEKAAITHALLSLKERKSNTVSFDLKKDLSFDKNGHIQLFCEVIISAPKLFIFGGGHVGEAVYHLSTQLGFDPTIIDERENIINKLEQKSIKTININYLEAIKALNFDDTTFIIVTTHSHKLDEQLVLSCLPKDHCYLGMIGSKKKVATLHASLVKNSFSQTQIDTIDAPIGIPFNAQTPEEIAVSIVAKIIDVKNNLLQ